MSTAALQASMRRAATFAGLRESVRCGVSAIGDIASCLPSLLFDEPPAEIGVTSFVELIGLSEARAAAQATRIDEYLASRNDAPNIRRGISPHAPYTVRPTLFEATVRAASAQRVPLAFHLAESRDELQLLARGDGPLVDYMRTLGAWDDTAIPRNTRPLDYLRVLAAAPRSLVIHGNYLADDEIEYLAAHADRMTTVYCPRTHAYFGHAPHPLPKLLQSGHLRRAGDRRSLHEP
ncbi:MAG: amidohydrolase family protein [Pirellulales bacterium]